MRFSPDGRHAYVVGCRGSVTVISFEDRPAMTAADPVEALVA